jgi:hypothetical protein
LKTLTGIGAIDMVDKSCIGPAVEGRGYNMGTASGRAVFPLDLRPEDVCLYDIAASLGRICRYNGHLKDAVEHYGVAQHSVHVSHLVGAAPKPVLIQALMHDAAEAYSGDMIRPIKVCIPQYEEIEHLIWNVICEKFDIDVTLDPIVKLADNVALATEIRDIRHPKCKADKGNLPPPHHATITPLRSFEARDLFLARAKGLGLI